MHRHAPATTLAGGRLERRSPVGFLGRQLEHAGVLGVLGQQFEAQGHRVLAHRRRNLIEENLGRVGRVRGADRAPPEHRHADIGRRMQIDQQVGDGVRQIGGAFDRNVVDTILDHHLERRAGQDRLPDQPVMPADQLAAAIERRFQRVMEHGPVVAAAHVVLAQPDQLDRGTCR